MLRAPFKNYQHQWKINVCNRKKLALETQKMHFSRYLGSRDNNQSVPNIVIIKYSRKAWSTKVNCLFLSFSDNMLQNVYIIIFHKQILIILTESTKHTKIWPGV